MRRGRDERDVGLLTWLHRLPFNKDVAAGPASAKRHEIRGERRLDARQRFDPGDDILHAARLGLTGVVCGTGHVEPEGQQWRGIEADLRPLQVEEASDEQRRADQQDQRQGHLRNDQGVAKPGAALAGAPSVLHSVGLRCAVARVRAEQGEKIPCHGGSDISLGLRRAICQCQAAAAEGGNGRERGTLVPDVEVIAIRHPPARDTQPLVLRIDDNDAVGFRVGKRPEENTVHHAEDGDVDANSEGETRYGNRGEPRAAGKGSPRVADVLEEHGALYVTTSSLFRPLA